MSGALTLAGWELRNAVRTRWVLGGGLAFAAGSLAVALLGLESARDLGLSGAGPASSGLVGLAMLLLPLLGLLLGAAAVAGARERGLLAMIMVQPLSTVSVIAGFFLGAVGALWLVIVLGLGAAGVVFGTMTEASDIASLVALTAATLAVSATSVGIGVAISSMCNGRAQATGWAVTIWFMLALGVDLAVAGVAPSIDLGPAGLLAAVLLNPIEAARVLALLGADTGGSLLGPFGAYMDVRYGERGAIVLLGGSLVTWTWAALSLAWWRLQRSLPANRS